MIANMSDLLRSTLGEHIRIENVSAGGLWTTKADAHQLESAILNIAINARDAMPGVGKLTIETANAYLDEAYCKQHAEVEPGQFVMIAITDTGTGMTPELVARIFEPFFTTKAPGAGTGLGLSQVYGFVKQSRGHIKVYSEPEAGTTVKIYLPRFIGEARELARMPSRPPEVGHSGEVILVVEDDALMRRLAGEALREVGYTVLDSENAVKALELLDSRPDIKLLFTDVVLPEVNGKKLADEASRRRPDLKVLFTTGYTPNAVVHGGILDAGVQFLTKPFTLEQVAAKVRAVLDSARTPALPHVVLDPLAGEVASCCAPFIKNLGTLGIEATLRIVDPEQYRKRVDEFELAVIATPDSTPSAHAAKAATRIQSRSVSSPASIVPETC
jgi:CheY-like chemotaxis protein